MRLPRVSIVLLLTVTLVTLTLSQDTEDSTTPKRVLKKYRVRRPVIVDDQGNVVRAGPRLRRVRVKNPRPTETSSQTSTSVTSTTSTSAPVPTPQPQILRQRTLVANQNAIPTERQVHQRIQPQQQQQPQPQPQNAFYEEQGVVEPIRTVPLTYRQPTSQVNREALLGNVRYKPGRGTGDSGFEEQKKVGTTRNYSKINEDGSFTFGYEADDGSFKEETRGVDCVVRGKYGYIDPEGVRREFEYVSGNPCDPNNPNPEEQSDEEEDSLTPSRPLIRQRVRPASELSENNIQGHSQTVEERLPEDQLVNFVRPTVSRQRIRPNPTGVPPQGLVLRQRVRITTPSPSPTLTSNQESDDEEESLFGRQRPFPPFQTPRTSVFQDVSQSLEDDNRRPSPSPTPSSLGQFGRGLFNFDQEVHRLASIPSRPHNQPQPLYEQPFRQVVHQPSQPGRQIFGNAAFRQEQATASPPTTHSPSPSPSPTPFSSSNGRYRTELVYDPNTGQYTSVQVQANPNTGEEFELTQKLRAFATPAPASTFSTPTSSGAFTQIQQFGQPQIQYYHQSQPQQGRSANPAQAQDPSQINQFLARHAYQPQPRPQEQQYQPQQQTRHVYQQPQQQTQQNLQFIPPHLRPGAHQTAEIQRQEVREVSFPASQGLSANSAAASNGQIDAFLRALNISI